MGRGPWFWGVARGVGSVLNATSLKMTLIVLGRCGGPDRHSRRRGIVNFAAGRKRGASSKKLREEGWGRECRTGPDR